MLCMMCNKGSEMPLIQYFGVSCGHGSLIYWKHIIQTEPSVKGQLSPSIRLVLDQMMEKS